MSKYLNSFKTFKPHTPSIRNVRLLNRIDLQKAKKPYKSLTQNYFYKNGRNNHGHVTVRHMGGRHKRLYRNIDFYRNKTDGVVLGFQHDPNRSSWIAPIFNPDHHSISYILGVKGFKSGNLVRNNISSSKISLGIHHILKDLPYGFLFHNLSNGFNKKGQYLRAAGAYGQLVSKTHKSVRIKIRSGMHCIFPNTSSVCIGTVSKENSKFVKIGKAGRSRWYGIRPSVRGVAINPVDHPHGGGEGKTSGGRPSVTPWGKPTKGIPTRKKIKYIPFN